MKVKLLIIGTLVSFSGFLFAQEEEWEPQKKITGYAALEGDYFMDLKYFDRDYAISLPEAGILANYKPIEKLTFKMVFVYRPNYTIDQMLNEANFEYKITDFLNAKAGRFLTPLSPINTYYYAPVNYTATLPMLIQNHEFFPLNMDAVSLNGKIGENFKIDYEAFAGGYRNALWLQTGANGLFGTENNYFTKVCVPDTTVAESPANKGLHFGGGGRLGIAFKDYISIGFGSFQSRETFVSEYEDSTGTVQTTNNIEKASYGFNIKAKYATMQLLGELWQTTVKMDFLGTPLDQKYVGAFVQLSNTFAEKITPYVRFEYHELPGFFVDATKYNRYTFGINYKPIFETTFKLEYMYYTGTKYLFNMATFGQDKYDVDLSGIVASIVYSF